MWPYPKIIKSAYEIAVMLFTQSHQDLSKDRMDNIIEENWELFSRSAKSYIMETNRSRRLEGLETLSTESQIRVLLADFAQIYIFVTEGIH